MKRIGGLELRASGIVLALVGSMAVLGCGGSQPITQSTAFDGLQVSKPAGVLSKVDQAKRELKLWHSDLKGAFVSVRRTMWPPDGSDATRAYEILFAHHSKAFSKNFPGAQFLGPAATFKTNSLTFYGGSWRAKHGAMASLTFTAADKHMFMIISVLPSTKSGSPDQQKARDALQQVVGSLEVASSKEGGNATEG